MATQAHLAAFRQAQHDVTALAYHDLTVFWATLDPTNPVAVVRALEAYLPDLINTYGEIGAAIAADFYDEVRADSGIRKAYSAVMGDAVPLEQIQASARWAAGPLFTPRPDFAEQTLNNVVSMTNRYVFAHGRRTLVTNVERDPARARFARVPSGQTTCAFCLMLASRGAVYATDEAAAHEFHDKCDCVPTPVWSASDYPEGYDPERLHADVYKPALKASDGSLKGEDGLLAAIREQHGTK